MKKHMSRLLVSILLVGVLVGNIDGLIQPAKAIDTGDCVMLNIPWNYIQQCGNQTTSGNKKACQAYAFTYCRIILDNTSYPWTKYRASGQNACAPGTAGYNSCTNTTSEQTILKAIYDNINLGRPVMLRAKGSSLFHYIVAIGYKTTCNPNSLTQSDIIILDPWDGAQKTLTAVPLKAKTNGEYGYWTAKSGGTTIINNSRTYTITLDANGGSVSPTTQTIVQDSLIGELPTPYRDGYKFTGWGTDKNTSCMIVSPGCMRVDQDMTLYATWKANCTNHSYDADRCTICDAKFPYDSEFDSAAAGTYQVSANTAYIRTGPYQVNDLIETKGKGETVEIVGSVTNSYGNTWLKTTEGYYTHAEKMTPFETETPLPPRGGQWGPWRVWSTTPVTETDTRQMETRQVKVSDGYAEYRYGRYVADGHDCWCAKYLEGLSYVSGSATLQYSNWSTTQYGTSGKGWSCGRCNGNHMGVSHTGSDGRTWWAEYLLPDGSYYWEESRDVSAVYETQYRYRDWIAD